MWWSEDEWAALVDPAACGMCADAHLEENDHSILVVSTGTTHVRFSRNQAHPGYCLVILAEHVTEMSELESASLGAFWSDVQRAGRAVGDVYGPRKIDYLVMGHRMPHLHCHVFPQHENDDPKRNVDISDGPALLTPWDMQDAVRTLRSAWGETA